MPCIGEGSGDGGPCSLSSVPHLDHQTSPEGQRHLERAGCQALRGTAARWLTHHLWGGAAQKGELWKSSHSRGHSQACEGHRLVPTGHTALTPHPSPSLPTSSQTLRLTHKLTEPVRLSQVHSQAGSAPGPPGLLSLPPSQDHVGQDFNKVLMNTCQNQNSQSKDRLQGSLRILPPKFIQISAWKCTHYRYRHHF